MAEGISAEWSIKFIGWMVHEIFQLNDQWNVSTKCGIKYFMNDQ